MRGASRQNNARLPNCTPHRDIIAAIEQLHRVVPWLAPCLSRRARAHTYGYASSPHPVMLAHQVASASPAARATRVPPTSHVAVTRAWPGPRNDAWASGCVRLPGLRTAARAPIGTASLALANIMPSTTATRLPGRFPTRTPRHGQGRLDTDEVGT